MPRQVSRRKFLIAAGAAVPAAAAAPALAESLIGGDPRSPGIVGTVVATGRHSLTIEVGGVRQKVVAAPAASISRGPVGPMVDVSAFAVGDRIAVDGAEAGGVWTATSIGTAFTGFHGTVDAVDQGDATMTADGRQLDIRRVAGGPGRLSRSEIEAGRHVSGLQWRNPAAGADEAVLVVGD